MQIYILYFFILKNLLQPEIRWCEKRTVLHLFFLGKIFGISLTIFFRELTPQTGDQDFHLTQIKKPSFGASPDIHFLSPQTRNNLEKKVKQSLSWANKKKYFALIQTASIVDCHHTSGAGVIGIHFKTKSWGLKRAADAAFFFKIFLGLVISIIVNV